MLYIFFTILPGLDTILVQDASYKSPGAFYTSNTTLKSVVESELFETTSFREK